MEFGESLKIAERLDVEVCRMRKKVNRMGEVSPETWFETFLKADDEPAKDNGQPPAKKSCMYNCACVY